ncbi:MAG: AzlD domain-containing protein [Bacillota bacterium]
MIITLAVAAGTLALRLSFIQLFGRVKIPPLLRKALEFVPASALSALVLPALLYRDDVLDISAGNERLVAGVIAALVAWRTGSFLYTVVVGMTALWVLGSIL